MYVYIYIYTIDLYLYIYIYISPVMEAIDERVNFDLSPFFVRDHIFLLLMQTLMAYNTQRTWGKEGVLQQVRESGQTATRGGADDQPPTVQVATFQQIVRTHAFAEAVEEDQLQDCIILLYCTRPY